jgi:pheromone shutdown-related protein TraB
VEGKRIVLVGTAHVSKKSVETVSKVIEEEKPDVVCVELCSDRKHALLEEKKWEETDIEKVVKEGRIYLFLIQVLLANFQRRVGEELGVKPGSEMLEAMKKAQEKNIPVELIDRDVRVTLKRAMDKTSFAERMRILGTVFSGFLSGEEVDEKLVEELKSEDMISKLLKELSEDAPSVKEVLVDERNRYIADRIASLDAKKIVAVVGAGHLKGIAEVLKGRRVRKDINAEIAELEKAPNRKSKLKYVGYAVPLLFLAIILWGFISHGKDVTLEMLWRWTVIHGVLSALGAFIAGGHILSVLTAFIASPYTSLDPTLAAGWFAGLVEIKLRKPRVSDFKGLFKLKSVFDWRKNRVTRVLLVVALTNLGSSLGTYIALPYLASLI